MFFFFFFLLGERGELCFDLRAAFSTHHRRLTTISVAADALARRLHAEARTLIARRGVHRPRRYPRRTLRESLSQQYQHQWLCCSFLSGKKRKKGRNSREKCSCLCWKSRSRKKVQGCTTLSSKQFNMASRRGARPVGEMDAL